MLAISRNWTSALCPPPTSFPPLHTPSHPLPTPLTFLQSWAKKRIHISEKIATQLGSQRVNLVWIMKFCMWNFLGQSRTFSASFPPNKFEFSPKHDIAPKCSPIQGMIRQRNSSFTEYFCVFWSIIIKREVFNTFEWIVMSRKSFSSSSHFRIFKSGKISSRKLRKPQVSSSNRKNTKKTIICW